MSPDPARPMADAAYARITALLDELMQLVDWIDEDAADEALRAVLKNRRRWDANDWRWEAVELLVRYDDPEYGAPPPAPLLEVRDHSARLLALLVRATVEADHDGVTYHTVARFDDAHARIGDALTAWKRELRETER
jgi:hypothetical protein